MKKYLLVFLFVSVGLGRVTAQSFINNISLSAQFPTPMKNKVTEVKILAVMVEFQVDKDEATFGDGTFGSVYSKDYGNSIIDPLPHNSQYFKNHLEFAQNYFSKVSNGKLNLSFDVFDQVIKVSKTIRDYSTANNKKDFTPLGNFSKEVWNIAASKGADFSNYNMFVIFHAGVGGDIILPGSIGNEKDLPSVFFNLNSFRNIFGESFNGFEHPTGTITNTAILPVTESREITGLTGTNLLQLSINGLIVASIGSFLGLPDLYNTDTGISAVGRFALMDGQSIFTYGGLFPPELSAWEKKYLGWIDPVEVNSDKYISVANMKIASVTDTVFIRIPISDSEYFLVENRKRDANKDGCKVTYKIGDKYFTQTFTNDINHFNYYDVDSIKGVVVDVDEFDWALPGQDSNDNDSFEDIGLLIWHIDENIINKNLSSNSINNGDVKGIKLVEADGIYDIGEKFTTVFGDEVIGDGSKEDTWYKTNPAHYYKNRFNDFSRPDSKSNTGANSLVSLSDFSDVADKMSFRVFFGNDQIKKISRFKIDRRVNKIIVQKISDDLNFIVCDGKYLSRYNSSGEILDRKVFGSKYKPAISEFNNMKYFFSADSNNFSIAAFDGNSLLTTTLIDSAQFSCPAAANIRNSVPEIFIGNENGELLKYSIMNGVEINLNGKQKIFSEPIRQIAVGQNTVAAISGKKYWDANNGIVELTEESVQLVVEEKSNGDYTSVVLCQNNKFFVIKNGNVISEIKIDGGQIKNFAFGDLRKDGNNFIIIVNGNKVEAYNINGILADNFPIRISGSGDLLSPIILADIDKDDNLDLIGFSDDGQIFAYNPIKTSPISSFPFAAEKVNEFYPTFVSEGNSGYLLFQDSELNINMIQLSENTGKTFWNDQYGNASNNSVISEAESVNKNEKFFSENLAYNWPNPVYDNITNIRFYVAENSFAEVKIFDLSGDLVDELSLNATGGMENEIVWNVKSIQSGIYFASLKVKSQSGKTGSKVIKIAVVK
jgi:hypothetical protein